MPHEEKAKKEKTVSLGTYIGSLIIVLALSAGGTYLFIDQGSADAPIEEEISEPIDLDIDEATLEDLSLVEEMYSILMTQYFEELDSAVLIEGALEGMADAIGDPYTEYLDEVESSAMDEDIQGSFEGIGAEVMKEGEFVRIVSPITGSPAEEAGLLPNDYILEVDGESVADLSINEAVTLIRGPQGSEVNLLIQRGDNQFDITLVRDSIPVESVIYEMDDTDETIGHVQITNFNVPTYEELVEAIETLDAQGAEKFIFDVRGNPGGLLDVALYLSNIFVEDGQPLMQTQERDEEEPFVYIANSDQYGDFKFEGEAVLLIDGGSASASEILAGAMQSVDIPLIGSTTFGKGTIQSILPLSEEGEIKFTRGRWLTAEGEWIDEDGINPDIEIEMPEYQNLLLIDTQQTYEEGDVSAEIENINAVLAALGYDLPESNLYSDLTVEAVENFQSENDLEVDGIVSGSTATALIDALRELIEQNDTQYDAAVDYLQAQ